MLDGNVKMSTVFLKINTNGCRVSVELHSDALIRIAAEKTPQDDHQDNDGYAGHHVNTVSAKESRRKNFEDNENPDEQDNTLKGATPHDPHRPARYVRELFIRRKLRH